MTSLPDAAWPARWLKTLGQLHGHRFAQRDELLARLTIRHGLRASELCALRFADVNVSTGCLRCGGIGRAKKARVRPLDAMELALVKALESMSGSRPGDPEIIFRTKSGATMGRIDVWRVLRRIGAEAGLETPLHTRRARHTLGHLTAESSNSDAIAVADTLGLQSLDAVTSYLPRCRRHRA